MKIERVYKSKYPGLLDHIDNQPEYLNYIGTLPPIDKYKYLCVVGARHHSEYGYDVCKKLISGLKNFPVVIVSGLAIGIDSIAHRVALENNIKTIAFPGSGLNENVLYPQQHLSLAKDIISAGGTLISPFPNEQTGAHWTFPTRNKLMAGISHATLIIEAKKGSGTLITADNALEFNRDVLTVPGSIFSELSYGPHMLIARGARPVFSSVDILEALGLVDPSNRTDENQAGIQLSFDNIILDKDEKVVIDELKIQNLQATDLALRTGLKPTTLNITLSKLEIKGLIEESGGVYKIKF